MQDQGAVRDPCRPKVKLGHLRCGWKNRVGETGAHSNILGRCLQSGLRCACTYQQPAWLTNEDTVADARGYGALEGGSGHMQAEYRPSCKGRHGQSQCRDAERRPQPNRHVRRVRKALACSVKVFSSGRPRVCQTSHNMMWTGSRAVCSIKMSLEELLPWIEKEQVPGVFWAALPIVTFLMSPAVRTCDCLPCR